jgi:hypothetical protein
VLPPARSSSRGALDDVIRKQLADQPTAQRQTAVTDGKPPSTDTAVRGDVSTGLFRKLDLDGLARLEEIDDTKVAAPRARRAPGAASFLRPRLAARQCTAARRRSGACTAPPCSRWRSGGRSSACP